MNEIFMALLVFGLGVLSTIFTQFFIRRLKLGDAKRQQQIDDIHQLTSWIESYRILFECKYPEVNLGNFIDSKPSENKQESDFTYHALKSFQEASVKCDEATRIGHRALKSIDDYHRGFHKTIYPLIETLEKARHDMFVQYPQQWYKVDFDRLDFIESNDLYLIIHHSGNWPRPEEYSREDYPFMLEEAHRRLRIEPANLLRIRRDAQQTIEEALEKVHKYEKGLLVVSS